jgi:hypothetical protein
MHRCRFGTCTELGAGGARRVPCRMPADDPEVAALLDAVDALLEALRRSLTQSKGLRERAIRGTRQ